MITSGCAPTKEPWSATMTRAVVSLSHMKMECFIVILRVATEHGESRSMASDPR
jgi:hypothetical protein